MREIFSGDYGIINNSRWEEVAKNVPSGSWAAFHPLVEKIKKTIGSQGKVLDLGSGLGLFVKCCMENGFMAVALEGSSSAVEWSRRNLGIDSRVHNLKDPLPFADSSFDCIIYNDVYEHVPQYINENVFREAFRILKPKGVFWVITICRYDFVEARELEHINLTTPSELYRFGEKIGFSGTVKLNNFNITLFTPYFYDRELKFSPLKKKIRDWSKRNQRKIDFVLAPFWIPVSLLNSKFLHLPALDLLSHKSEVVFRKIKTTLR
ncbi:MAG: class I SAM-dependent methyltransferase [Candidatus Omnitrophica bacterium]|nr:class I SAM-dependent methyltransferase [Candidatus Omnitrophota bacterium]